LSVAARSPKAALQVLGGSAWEEAMARGEFSFCPVKSARLLHVLAHRDRLRIMSLIVENEWDVGSLCREINLGQPALSRHLRKMRDLGVVQTRRSAQTIYYSCNDAAVVTLLKTLLSIWTAAALSPKSSEIRSNT
jgi:ArsR family transcriptional regulator, virulence genes transcriptional regulator